MITFMNVLTCFSVPLKHDFSQFFALLHTFSRTLDGLFRGERLRTPFLLLKSCWNVWERQSV